MQRKQIYPFPRCVALQHSLWPIFSRDVANMVYEYANGFEVFQDSLLAYLRQVPSKRVKSWWPSERNAFEIQLTEDVLVTWTTIDDHEEIWSMTICIGVISDQVTFTEFSQACFAEHELILLPPVLNFSSPAMCKALQDRLEKG